MLKQLGEFTIKKLLGEGGMGAVYLAYQESLDRNVALKILTERLCKNETYIARFKREARSAASIIHPHVIQIYSIGEENGIHYFAMEYVRGMDLAAHLVAGRKFNVEESIDIVMQVAEACACASEAGIVHRDLKPANIMLTDRGLVKVTDYGLAKAVSSDLDVTEAGTIVGTANYMSPEQGQGKSLDVRSDIYSLGIMFFELLAGRAPFIADQPSAVLYMHVYESPPPPSKFNHAVTPAVDRMVLRMMAKNPDDRPRVADELLRELRGLSQSLGGSGAAIAAKAEVTAAVQESTAETAVMAASSQVGQTPLAEVFSAGALKALVADDIPSVRKLYNKVLGEMGFTVLEAADGEQTLSLWQEQRPSLILLDLNMPKLDGLAVLQERNNLKLGGEVIVVSARKDRDTVARVAGENVSGYLTKPVNIVELRSRIEKVMSRPSARKALSDIKKATQPDAKALIHTSRQIVVYDPSVYALSLYRGILETMGHQPACVDTPGDVLEVLNEDIPDLLIVAVSRSDERGFSLVEEIRERQLDIRIIVITDEQDEALAKRMNDMNLGPVLAKPVRVGELRGAVEQALAESKLMDRPTILSACFSQIVDRQLSRDQAYTVFDYARELAGALPEGARGSFERRLENGSVREIQTAITNLLRRLKDDGKGEIGMRYLRHAYVNGNLEVRNFCLALLPELLTPKEEIEVLMKLVTDEDFRIRCQVLARLGNLRAEDGAEIIVRFLNDEVWKVRKAAAACLEQFEISKVLEPLIRFYARSGEPLPDRIRNRLIGHTGASEMNLLEKLARNGNVDVRCFVANFLGELQSKLSVRILLSLLRDKDPQVRAGSARAGGRVKNEKLRDAMVLALTDSNSEVQTALIEGLMQYPMPPGAAAFLLALRQRGRRISEDAIRFFATLNQRPHALTSLLERIGRQSESNRKHLSLLLASCFPESEIKDIIRRLNSQDQSAARQGIEQVTRAVQKTYNDLSREIRRQQ